MSFERWSRVQALFVQAEALPQHERAEFLERRCDDPALRMEVEALLDGDQTTRAAFERPNPAPLGETLTKPLPPGTRLGPWRLGPMVGRGGMGEVYEARRADGAFELRVAVKLLKRGLDTDAVVARFARERRILARLDHPNVAHILDAGASDDGRPFLVMEYVQGQPITEYARAEALSTHSLLRLMITACEAVQAAHAGHIVHRDLKPSNIFVTTQGQVKLLDFGVAKALLEEDAEATRMAGERAGLTPAYAAPEQLLGFQASAATDVYSLGVVLYQLLVDKLPHARGGRTVDEIAARLDHETLTRPSATLRQDDGRMPQPVRLERLKAISRDLDLIVLKAMHREPSRRYADAQAFADDLRRLLDSRPVLAMPDSAAYRVSRYVRRNRLAVAAAASVILALSAGLVGALWQAHQARLARDESSARRVQADDLIGFMLGDLAERLHSLGRLDILDSTASKAMDYLAASNNDNADAETLTLRSSALSEICQIRSNQGQMPEAIAAGEKAVEAARALKKIQPGIEADKLLVNAIYTYGAPLAYSGQFDKLRQVAQEGRDLVLQLSAEKPDDSAIALLRGEVDHQFGYVNSEGGGKPDVKAAAAAFQDCITVLTPYAAREDATAQVYAALLRCYDNMVTTLGQMGQEQDSLAALRTMVADAEAAAQRFPKDAVILQRLVVAATNASSTFAKSYQYDDAYRASDLALQAGARLMSVDSDNMSALQQLELANIVRAGLDLGQMRLEQATHDIDAGQDISKKVLQRQPDSDYAHYLAGFLAEERATVIYKARGSVEQGLREIEEGLALSRGYEKNTKIQWQLFTLRAMQWLFDLRAHPDQAAQAVQAVRDEIQLLGGDKAAPKFRAVLAYLDGHIEDADGLLKPYGWNAFISLSMKDIRDAACTLRVRQGGPACTTPDW